MRVIHLVSGDLWAGAEVQLFHLASNLVHIADVALLVIVLNEGQLASKLRDCGVQVEVLDEAKLSSFQIFGEVLRLAKKFKPDVVHTHRKKENIIGGIVSKLIGCKSIRTVHGASEFSNACWNIKSWVINTIDNFVAKLFQHKIVAVSHELKSKLESQFSMAKLEVIENCIDIDFVNEMSLEDVNAKINSEHFNIAFVGRFVDVKRVDLFIEIAKSITEETDLSMPITFHMIGDGPLWNDAVDSVKQMNLEDVVRFEGFVKNTAPYLKQMDLLLFTSDHEGLPMTLLEAMALNVTVMSRNLETIKHVLCGGECGYILKSDQASDFSEEIIELVNNQEIKNKRTNMASAQLGNHYSIDSLINKYMCLYSSIRKN